MFSSFAMFLNGTLSIITELYIIRKITKRKPKWTFLNICICIVLAILIPLSFLITDSFLRLFIVVTISAFVFRQVCEMKILEAFLSSIFAMIIVTISEVLFISLLILFFKESLLDVQTVWIGSILSNVVIYTISASFILIKPVRETISKVVNWSEKRQMLTSIFLLVLVVITSWIIAYINVTQQLDVITYTMTIAVVLCLAILAITLFNEKITNENNSIQYKRLKDYVHTYETLLKDLRENQHENKNKMLTIRGMVDVNNKRLLDFLNDELDSIPKIKHSWVVKLTNISDSGLKGLLYSKMMLMEDAGINFYLDISKTIKNNDKIENLSIEYYKNLCTIIGVYLDNAIEAASEVEDPQVLIEFFYLNDKLQIVITNNYNGLIDKENIDQPGISSKGENHGYGLSLINKILVQNKGYKQSREITDEYYIQYFELSLND